MSLISGLLDRFGIKPTSLAETDAFARWCVNYLWKKFQDERMNKRTIAENEIKNLALHLPNGTVLQEYNYTLTVPNVKYARNVRIDGLEEFGLSYTYEDEENQRKFTITGIPIKSGDFNIKLRFSHEEALEGEELIEITLPIAFNPDPRTQWNDIPTSKDIPHYKEDNVCDYVKVETTESGDPRKDIVAASRRGRSHAHNGKPRDDHFRLHYNAETDWYVIAVADGAGSAKLSRKGSEIACNSVVDYCAEKLKDVAEFEAKIALFNEDKNTPIRNEVYDIVVKAAFEAHKKLVEAVKVNEVSVLKDFSTTILFAICKKFSFGWFIASFWIGDGAMAIFNKTDKTFKLLGTPDEGEYSGQTRFLTMSELFKDPQGLVNRLRYSIEPDFTSLMLMTDGVSDPMFKTVANMEKYEKWQELWDKLKNGFPDPDPDYEIGGVNLTDDNEASKDELLAWLNFWAVGEHDDRTIAILY